LSTQSAEVGVQQPVHEGVPQTIAQRRPGDQEIEKRR